MRLTRRTPLKFPQRKNSLPDDLDPVPFGVLAGAVHRRGLVKKISQFRLARIPTLKERYKSAHSESERSQRWDMLTMETLSIIQGLVYGSFVEEGDLVPQLWTHHIPGWGKVHFLQITNKEA